MLLTAERLEGESNLDDDAAGDKDRRRAETALTLELETRKAEKHIEDLHSKT